MTLITAQPLGHLKANRHLLQLWRIYTSLPTQLSKDYAQQRKLQAEYLACRKELNSTSSQDQFAKWAKLRRKHDTLLEELEKKSTAILSYSLGFRC